MNNTHKEYMNLVGGLKDVPPAEMSSEEAGAYLASQGYDTEKVSARLMKSTQDALLKHTWQYQADENLKALAASEEVSKWSDKTPDEIRAAFDSRQRDPDFAMAARNMEHISVEEMRAMLEDFDELDG